MASAPVVTVGNDGIITAPGFRSSGSGGVITLGATRIAPPLSNQGQATLYFNGTTIMVSMNGSPYRPLL